MFGINKKPKQNTAMNNTGKQNEVNNIDDMSMKYASVDYTANANMSKRQKKKAARRAVFKEKLDMYDMMLVSTLFKDEVTFSDEQLDNSQISIELKNVNTAYTVSKYFMIKGYPDFLQPKLIDEIRNRCVRPGVKINFFFLTEPYKIAWDSQEMKNRLSVWKTYINEDGNDINVFEYRNQRNDELTKRRIVMSTRYLNDAELNQKRSLMKVAAMIEFTSNRDEESIYNMGEAIEQFRTFCGLQDIRLKEIKINIIEWLKNLWPFSLADTKEIRDKTPYRVMTDDLFANFHSFKQGRIGLTGCPLGMDVNTNEVVLRKFKADPDMAENWLICAGTGGGKSYWIKSLLSYLLADGFVVTVMDYEGDEYTNYAYYIKSGNDKDVKIVSMGKGSTTYFDPCVIPKLTGDPEVDSDLKDSSMNFIMALFRVITCGVSESLDTWSESVISTAINRVYDSAGVTNDKNTWYRSRDLRLYMVYEELKNMYETKETFDPDSGNVKHMALMKIVNAAKVYFEEGEAKYGTFAKPMSADELFEGKLIIFSFGMKGAAETTMDPVILELKQLSVAYISIQISNYCKYVKKCFNVKVWEEYQRWGQAAGSADIISNVMTGGRKRGDVNFIITNDLANIVSDSPLSEKLRQNIQNFAIGYVKDLHIIEKFCTVLPFDECQGILETISRANRPDIESGADASSAKYAKAFCIILDNGKRTVVKSKLPPSLAGTKLFKTGVEVK